MPTMRGGQFEVVKEMFREKDDIIDAQASHIEDVEEELEASLEKNAEDKATISALEAEIRRLMSDRSFRD